MPWVLGISLLLTVLVLGLDFRFCRQRFGGKFVLRIWPRFLLALCLAEVTLAAFDCTIRASLMCWSQTLIQGAQATDRLALLSATGVCLWLVGGPAMGTLYWTWAGQGPGRRPWAQVAARTAAGAIYGYWLTIPLGVMFWFWHLLPDNAPVGVAVCGASCALSATGAVLAISWSRRTLRDFWQESPASLTAPAPLLPRR